MTPGHPSDVPLTEEEKRAIAALKRLAKKWPKSLWLFSGSGTLHVMRNGTDGRPVYHGKEGGVDANYAVWSTREIPNDGGDW